MTRKSIQLAAGMGLIGIMFLAACTGKSTPTATATATAAATAQPEVPTAPASLYSESGAYPLAAEEVQAGYPAPGAAYPDNSSGYLPAVSAGSAAYPEPTAYPAPLATDPSYPFPVEAPTAALPSYPFPGVNPSPTIFPVELVATATPLIINTPTPRPTRDIYSELHATDPAGVQLASGKVQLVEFFAFWDGTSKAMAPLMNALEAEYGDRMNFIFLDIDNPATQVLKKQLGFRVQPQFILLDEKGGVLKRWSGFVKEADFHAAFEAALD